MLSLNISISLTRNVRFVLQRRENPAPIVGLRKGQAEALPDPCPAEERPRDWRRSIERRLCNDLNDSPEEKTMRMTGRRNAVLTIIAVAAMSACGGDARITAPPPPSATVLLKDIVIPSLPSPYYHFEYDAQGKVSTVSFASGFTMYDVTYAGGRVSELRNNIIVNHDRLVYVYDDAGRVAAIRETDENGVVFTVLFFTYAGEKLSELERDRRVTGGFSIDKTMMFSYYPDGNLLELTEHRPAIDGLQGETTVKDRFEQYDNGINVDGFGLIHDDFFDHF